MPESIESSRFVSNEPRMSREFEQSPPVLFVKLSFRKLCDSHVFDLQT